MDTAIKKNEKTQIKGEQDNFNHLKVIEFSVIVALIFLKLLYFYLYIGIGIHALTLLLESLVLLSLTWLLIVRYKKKMPFGFTFGLYLFTSVAMIIDLTYFNYFGKLPSIFMLSNTGFIGDVGASVLKLLSFSSLLVVLDLPFVVFYIIFIRKKLNKKNVNVLKRFKKLLPILLISVSTILVADVILSRFMLKDLQNEFIVFHTVDFGRFVFGVKENEKEYNKTIKTDYTVSPLNGIADGRNLIVIQIESLQGFTALRSYNGKEITPNINRLISEGAYFENYYYQTGGGNTSDAEFTVNNSLFAPEYESAYIKYAENSFYGLPWILKENGFKTTAAYHAFKGSFWNREEAYVNQGFDIFISKKNTNVLKSGYDIGLGMNDRDFLMQSLEHIKTLEKPFYSFLVTLTSHHPYIMPFENRFDILPEDEGTIFADYISSINYIDECIGEFLDGLKKAKLYDNSVIVIYGDHFAIPLNEVSSADALERLLSRPYDYEDFLKVPCVISIPNLDEDDLELLSSPKKITGGHADLMPTILDLYGYKSDKMILFGQNLFAANEGIVYPQASLQRGSYVDDEVVFVFPQSKMLINAIAFNKENRTPIEPELCSEKYKAALAAYADSSYLLESNIFKDILKDGRETALEKIEEALKASKKSIFFPKDSLE